jgi:hypothetical protein
MSQHTSTDAPELQALLVEYEKTQDSAQHHDSLGWTSVSFVFGGMLVLLGFALDSMENQKSQEVLLFVGWLGIALTIAAVVVALQFNSITRFKYNRCREIESQIGAQQHQKVPHIPGSQRIILVIIALGFIAVWLKVMHWL